MFYFCAFADYDVTMRWASSQTFHCIKLLLIQFLCKIYLSGAGGMSKMRLVRLRLVRLGGHLKCVPISASNKCVCTPKMRLVASASVMPGHA